MKKSKLLIFIGGILTAILLFFLIRKVGQRDELNLVCAYHKDLYNNHVVGVITDHYVDSTDHARRTVIINDQYRKEYEVWFIPYENWADFDKIKVNDTINKQPHSFVFLVNNEFRFELKLECGL
jgi:hypothetical protein